ncbi:hypothetical protein ykris0001_35920 [Yersinia kristensenii ATCC 33638]|nr:hypothetical protein ykris0001_22330 [Yersinia kristensenii ATCC 33638]EEP93460.1 hypothetical protein ykris0001_35920 [Yersinia kristensenii ATCC 33638]
MLSTQAARTLYRRITEYSSLTDYYFQIATAPSGLARYI